MQRDGPAEGGCRYGEEPAHEGSSFYLWSTATAQIFKIFKIFCFCFYLFIFNKPPSNVSLCAEPQLAQVRACYGPQITKQIQRGA
jgi:hypothetical protein